MRFSAPRCRLKAGLRTAGRSFFRTGILNGVALRGSRPSRGSTFMEFLRVLLSWQKRVMGVSPGHIGTKRLRMHEARRQPLSFLKSLYWRARDSLRSGRDVFRRDDSKFRNRRGRHVRRYKKGLSIAGTKRRSITGATNDIEDAWPVAFGNARLPVSGWRTPTASVDCA